MPFSLGHRVSVFSLCLFPRRCDVLQRGVLLRSPLWQLGPAALSTLHSARRRLSLGRCDDSTARTETADVMPCLHFLSAVVAVVSAAGRSLRDDNVWFRRYHRNSSDSEASRRSGTSATVAADLQPQPAVENNKAAKGVAGKQSQYPTVAASPPAERRTNEKWTPADQSSRREIWSPVRSSGD